MQKDPGEKVALHDALCTFLSFPDLLKWVTLIILKSILKNVFISLNAEKSVWSMWVECQKQEREWEGREVKGEVKNENGNQTSKNFGFHV